jgi:hypothetical protein
MHIDRRLVGFGLFLITVGGVMVAVRQGVLSEAVARSAWHLWPLILIGIGLSIVLAGRPGAATGGLVLAVTFGAIVGGVASTGSLPGTGLCGGSRDDGTAFPDRGGNLGAGARITITHDCGDLAVGTVAGSTWSVSGRAANGVSPRIDSAPDRLRISGPDHDPLDLDRGSVWNVVLPRDTPLDLVLEVNGGDSRLALAGATLETFSVAANAGSVDLDLRDVGSVGPVDVGLNFGSATIHLPNRSLALALEVNAGSASLCLPAGAGLQVKLDSVAGSSDLDRHGLTEVNGSWQTPGYATAEVRLDVTATVNAGTLSLDPTRSCAG